MIKAILSAVLSLLFLCTADAMATPEQVDTKTPTAIPSESRFADYLQSPIALRARQNWMLNCQGCHKPDGSGHPSKGMPDMRGVVANFLNVEGGRAYLGSVPGVTNAALDDEALAELLEWTLMTFDPAHIPGNHTPYTAKEIKKLRSKPLAVQAPTIRDMLLKKLSAEN